MSSMASRARRLWCVLFLSMVWCSAVAALSITKPFVALHQSGLNDNEDSLIGYLTDGLPSNWPESSDPWGIYYFITVRLGEVGSRKSVPVLLERITDPLPPALHEELETHVAQTTAGSTWEDWDRTFLEGETAFRVDCASALAVIGDDRALQPLIAYRKSLEPAVLATLKDQKPDSRLIRAYGFVCKAIAALGSKDGIDSLVLLLDDLPTMISGDILYDLFLCTGHTFDSRDSAPPYDYQSSVKKWKTWWSQNRDTFQIDRSHAVNTWMEEPLPNPPRTLREQVVVAESRNRDLTGRGCWRPSVEWLEANCKSQIKGLAAIVNDKDEDIGIRTAAMQWYARSGDRKALTLLTKYARSKTRYDGSASKRSPLRGVAMELIAKSFPKEADKVARKCVLLSHGPTGCAADLLMKTPEGLAYVVGHYDRLAQENRFRVIMHMVNLKTPEGIAFVEEHYAGLTRHDRSAVIMHMVNLKTPEGLAFVGDHYAALTQDDRSALIMRLIERPEPVDAKFYVEALKDSVPLISWNGAKGILKFGLREKLLPDAAEVLAKWEADPAFQLSMVAPTGDKQELVEKVNRVLESVKTHDPKAAAIYRWALSILPEEQKAPVLKELDLCIEAYRKRNAEKARQGTQ